jgi:hypothetical protein
VGSTSPESASSDSATPDSTSPDSTSLFERLEPLLASVSKPIQYVGGELNSVVKDWGSAEVRWCLMYPDAYEVGLPNQGVAILSDGHDSAGRRG